MSQPTGAGDPRGDLERISAPLLRRLTGLPRPVVLIVVGAWLLAGLLLSAPWGPLLLLLLAGILGWLLAVGWPALASGGRLFRLVVLLGLAGVAGSRLAEYFSN